MLRIVLILPGSTDFDEQRRILGSLDVPLNASGSDEAANLARELRIHGIEVLYTSGCSPAEQTAETIAAALDLKVKKLDNLRNLDHGLWQGMLVEEVKSKQPRVYRQWQAQPETIRPPEGEMLGEVRARVESVLRRLLKRHKEGVIGIVVPEPLASVVRSQLRHEALGDLWKAPADKKRCEVIEIASSQPLSA